MLITDFLKYVLQDVPGCPTLTASQAVLDSAKRFFTESSIWDEIQDPLMLAENTADYDLDAPTNARCINVRAVYASWMPRGSLVGITQEQLARSDPAWATALGSLPSHYTRAKDFSSLTVYPIPTAPDGHAIRIHGVYTLTDRATAIPDELVERFQETIAAGAKYRLLRTPKTNWQDLKLAGYYEDIFQDGISEARIQAEHSKTRGHLVVQPRPYF